MVTTLELVLLYLAAAIAGVVAFRMLRLPPVLGYLVAGVLIGPNAFVNSDVPDGVVVSAPAGIIVSSGGTEGYIDNPAEPTAS